MTRTYLLLAVTAAALACAPSLALGQDAVPPGNSGIDQYAPSLPAAENDRGPGVDTHHGTRSIPLARSIQAALPGGREGALLEQIATSTDLGSPDTRAGGRTAPDARHGAARGDASRPGLASTVFGTIFGSGHSAIWILLIAMATVVGVIAAVRLRQRRE